HAVREQNAHAAGPRRSEDRHLVAGSGVEPPVISSRRRGISHTGRAGAPLPISEISRYARNDSCGTAAAGADATVPILQSPSLPTDATNSAVRTREPARRRC